MIFLGAGALLRSNVTYAVKSGCTVDCVYTLSHEFKMHWQKLGVPYAVCSNYNQEWEAIVDRCSDGIVFSINNTVILKDPLISHPSLKLFNVHSGLLPQHRGRPEACIVFALLQGHSLYGATLHLIDGGIDTGAVLTEKTFEVKEEDTFESVMSNALESCRKIFEENLQAVINNNYQLTHISPGSSRLYRLSDLRSLAPHAHLPGFKRATSLGIYSLWYGALFSTAALPGNS